MTLLPCLVTLLYGTATILNVLTPAQLLTSLSNPLMTTRTAARATVAARTEASISSQQGRSKTVRMFR